MCLETMRANGRITWGLAAVALAALLALRMPTPVARAKAFTLSVGGHAAADTV